MASLYREISSLSADIATHATENYKLNSDIVLIVKSFNKKNMTTVEQNQFNMMQSVDKFFSNHQSQISNIPAIVAASNKLKSLIGDINSHSQVQAVSTKADSAIKADAKNSIIDNVLKVAAGMAAHAASTSDTRLKIAADITRSELKKMRDADLLIKIRAIHDAALPIVAELAIWGVTPSDVDALVSIADEYSTQSPGIRNLKAKTTQATINLKAKFDETNTLIKSTLDPMMLPFKNLNPTLHGEYLKARVIIDLGGGYTTPPVDTKPAE